MRHSQRRWIAPPKRPAHRRWMIAVDGADGTLAMGVLGLLAVLAREPMIFPSLGTTAYLLFAHPHEHRARFRNAFLGHLVIEHDYRRHGVCANVAAWDVHRAQFGRVVPKISIEVFDALVADAMARPPYRSGRHVFFPTSLWCTRPRTPAGSIRSRSTFRSSRILQRKELTPADFPHRDAVAARILDFQDHYQAIARPFEWKFTRRDLHRLLQRSATPEEQPCPKAA